MDHSNGKSRQQRRAEARAADGWVRPNAFLLPELNEAEPCLDAVTQGDAAFFGRAPDRSHRVRHAELVEIHEFLACGGPATVPLTGKWCALVHQLRPGVRFRRITILPEDTDTDAGEEHARALWAQSAAPGSDADRIVAAPREYGL